MKRFLPFFFFVLSVAAQVPGPKQPRIVTYSELLSLQGTASQPYVQVPDRGDVVLKWVAGGTSNNTAEVATTNGAWKLQNWNGDVKAFGVKADGSTDDTATLRSAGVYAKANRVKMRFPGGDYLVNSGTSNVLQLDWAGAILEGESSAGASTNAPPQRFIDIGSGTTLLIGNGVYTGESTGIEVMNLGFYSTSAQSAITLTNYAAHNNFKRIHIAGYNNGFRSHWSWGNTFYDFTVVYSTQDNIRVTGNTLDWRVYSIHSYFAGRNGLRFEIDTNKPASSGIITENFKIFGGSISHNGEQGLYVDGGRGIQDYGVYYEANGSNDLHYGTLAFGCSTINPVFLGVVRNGIRVDGAYNYIGHPYFWSIPLTNAGVYLAGSANVLDSHPYFCKTLGSGASITFTSGTGFSGIGVPGTTNFYTNVLTSADLVIASGGTGYHTNVLATVSSAAGGGATVRLDVDGTTGAITNAVVVQGGSGYTTNGTVLVTDLGNYVHDAGSLNVIDGVASATSANGTVPGWSPGAAFTVNPSTGQWFRQTPNGSITPLLSTIDINSEVDNNLLIEFRSQGGRISLGGLGIFPTNRQLSIGTDSGKKLLIGAFRLEPEVAGNRYDLGQAARAFYQGFFELGVFASMYKATNSFQMGTWTAPTNPPTGNSSFYFVTNGSGKKEFVVNWGSTTNIIATQP